MTTLHGVVVGEMASSIGGIERLDFSDPDTDCECFLSNCRSSKGD